MSAISHIMGGDLILNGSGGLAIVGPAEQARQSILRRLCTNPGDYLWHLEYGAGLPGKIGQPMNADDILTAVKAQMATEEAVDQTTPPKVALTDMGDGAYLCLIQYVDLQTQTVQSLTFQT